MGKRLGISELYASLILLVIISTMGVILYNYAVETTMKYQESFIEQENQNSQKVLEHWEIVNVNGDPINDKLNITIYNYGGFDFEIDKVYINDVIATSFSAVLNKTVYSMDINKLTIDSPLSIQNGEKYTVMVVSRNGVKSSYVWKK